MTIWFSPYEVLSQPLIPQNVAVPYITQGIFVQILNSISQTPLTYTISFVGQPELVANTDGIDLMIEYIDNLGVSNPLSVNDFINNSRTQDLTIPYGGCFLFGVQYILPDAIKLGGGGTPQNSAAARGVVAISADSNNISANQIFVTTRQYYTKYNDAGQIIGKSAAAYGNPLERG